MTAWVGLVVALASASVAGLVVVGFAFGRRASTSNEWLGRAALGSVVGLGLSLYVRLRMAVSGGSRRRPISRSGRDGMPPPSRAGC